MKLVETLISRSLAASRGPIARGSITSMIIRVAGIGLAFLQSVLMARLLGAEGLGIVSVTIAVVQLAANISVLGLASLAVREIAAMRVDGNSKGIGRFLLGAILVLCLVSAMASAFALLAFEILDETLAIYTSILPFALGAVPVIAFIYLWRGTALGFGDVAGGQIPHDVARPLLLCLWLGPLFLGAASLTHVTFMQGYLAVNVLVALLGGWFVWRNLRQLPKGTSKAEQPRIGEHLRKAMPFLGISLLLLLQSDLATMMLAALAGPEQAGLYQPVGRMAALLLLPNQVVAARFDSRASELWQAGEKERLVHITRSFTRVTTLATLALALPLAAAAWFILHAFGAEFVQMAPAVWIMAAGYVLAASLGPAGRLNVTAGNAAISFRWTAGAIVLNLAAGTLLIPPLGALGAAIAMALALLAHALGQSFSARRNLGFDFSIWDDIARRSAAKRDS